MSADAKAHGSNIVSLDVAAKILKCTPRWIQQLAKDGWIQKAGRGGYPLVGLIHGYIDWRDDADRRSTKSASASRVSDRRADEIELRIAEKSGNLIKDAQMESLAICDDVIGGLRTDLLSVPARVTSDLIVRQKVEAAIDDAFRASAKRVADQAARAQSGVISVDASEEDIA